MRVLVTTQPGIGHLNSLMPLARALRASGHEITFATSASFRQRIEERGFDAVAAGMDFVEARAADSFADLGRIAPRAASIQWAKSVWLGPAARAMAADVREVIAAWKPDVVVHDFWEFGGPLAAERAGIPSACLGRTYFRPADQLATFFSDQLRGLRASAGVDAEAGADHLYRYLYLDLYPPALQLSAPRLPTVHRVRPGPFAVDGAIPEWLSRLDDSRPTIYASLGTVFAEGAGLTRRIVEACVDLDVNLIVSRGSSADGSSPPGAGPEKIQVHDYVPQPLVLEACDVFITHGGSNSIIEALMNAVPMLCLPLSAEQPVNAINCHRAGVALWVDPEKADPPTIRRHCARLLGDPIFRRRATEAQEEMAALPPVSHAVALLERLARTGRPVMTARELPPR